MWWLARNSFLIHLHRFGQIGPFEEVIVDIDLRTSDIYLATNLFQRFELALYRIPLIGGLPPILTSFRIISS